jgi:hypothetical protein
VHVDRIGEVHMRLDVVFSCCTGFAALRSSVHGGQLHFGIEIVNSHCLKMLSYKFNLVERIRLREGASIVENSFWFSSGKE